MTRTAFLALALFLLVLPGCGNWKNPEIADPAERDEVLERDMDYCMKRAQRKDPAGPGNDQYEPRLGPRNQISNYETDFEEDANQDAAFERCMRARGWTQE